VEKGLVGFTFLEKRVAKIIIRVREIWLHLQSFPVMSDCLVNFAFLKKYDAQIIVSHPAGGVSCQRRPPERFDVSIHRALPPSQHRQGRNHGDRRAKDQTTAPFESAS